MQRIQRSKSLALMFLLGAVLVGSVLGFTASRVMAHEDALGPGGRPTTRASFYDMLQLTTAQRASVDTILDEQHRQIAAVMKPIRPQLDSIKDNARGQIRRVLTPAQQARLDAFEARARDSHSTRKEQTGK